MRNKVFPEGKHGVEKDLIPKPLKESGGSRCATLWVFHPESAWRLLWDIQIMVLIFYQAIAVPFRICFEVPETSGWIVLEVFINIVFMLDILISFNTGFYLKGILVMNRKKITKNYLKFWFWLDLLASLPYTWFIDGLSEEDSDSDGNLYRAPQLLRLIKIFRFLRILKLLRLAKLKRILIKIEDYIASNTLATLLIFFRLLSVVFFMAHWTACWWYFIGNQDSAIYPVTWVVDAGIQNHSLSDRYISSLYWAFTTMTTVGYGDIKPVTPNEQVYAMFSMILACGIFAYIVGSIGSLVSKQNALENEYREQFVLVNRYMKKKSLPHDLQFRVRRYLEYVWENKKKRNLGEKEILSLLSEPLRDDVNDHIHGVIVKSCSVFSDYGGTFISHLTRKLEKNTFAPGDIVIEEGERSSHMFFIQNGRIELFHHRTKSVYVTLTQKDYFGEIAFYSENPRCASARCLDYVDLLVLSRDDLTTLIEKFPEAKTKTTSILEDIQTGDLSSLRVVCYICNSLGHVAVACNQVSIKINTENSKQIWIDRRLNSSTHLLNPYTAPLTDFRRRKNRKVRKEIYSRNIISKSPDKMYAAQPEFDKKIKRYADKSFLSIDEDYPSYEISDEISLPLGLDSKNRQSRALASVYDDSEESDEEPRKTHLSVKPLLKKRMPPPLNINVSTLKIPRKGFHSPNIGIKEEVEESSDESLP